MDLDALIAKVTGKRQASKQQRPRQKRAKAAGFDLDAIVRSVTGQAPVSKQIGALWKRVVAAEARHADPRPSRAFHVLLKALPASQRDAVINERGVWLQRARERLPRQPPIGASLPPLNERYVEGPDGQRVRVPAGALTAIEPFAGAGLLGLALHIEQIVTVDLCEIDKWAIETQRLNRRTTFGLGWNPERQDAWKWEPVRIKGNVDLLIGGPPCKPFSKGAELGRASREMGATAKDNFFPRALDWICDLQPRVVAFENSNRLVDYAPFRRWLMDVWGEQLAAIGYQVHAFTMYAADYGTPQNRNRAWVICWPIGQDRPLLQTKPAPTHGRPGTPAVEQGKLLPWVPMHDRLISGCCGGYGLVDCVHLGNDELRCRVCSGGSNFRAAPNTTGDNGRRNVGEMTVRSKRRRKTIPMAQYMLEVMSQLRPDQRRYLKFAPVDFAGAWSQTKKMEIGKGVTRYLSRTVVPMFSKPPAGLMIPPGLDRWGDIDRLNHNTAKKLIDQLEVMSVRDAAKLQDVPQWYGFAGPRSACFTQIGMGVPVSMGRALARWLRRGLGLSVRSSWYDDVQHGITAIPEGLWPLDALDPCIAFPGVIEGAPYSQEQAFYDWSELASEGMLGEPDEVSGQARSRRPSGVLQPLSRKEEARERTAAQQIGAIFPHGQSVDSAALWRSGWRPSGVTDAPYPFDDVYWFAEYVRERSRDPTWYNFWALYYRRSFGVGTKVWGGTVARLWPLEPDLGLPEPFPSDAPFTARTLAGELRKQK